jgi:hypothetical protein
VRRGRTHRAGADGRLTVPSSGAELWLSARDGELGGVVGAPAGAEAEVILIELAPQPRRCVEVEVVDEAGRPRSDVEVAVVQELPFRSSGARSAAPPSWPARIRVRASGTTDAAGRAALEIGASASTRWTAEVDDETAVPSYATFAFPHHPRVTVPLHDAPTGRPLRLVLPPTGQLVVEAVGPDGRALSVPNEVSLAAWPADAATAGTAPFFELRRRIPSGRLALAHTGLGLKFQLRANWAGTSVRTAADLAGPTSAGERSTLCFEIANGLTVATARLLEPSGKPLASARVDAELRTFVAGREGEPAWSTLETDGEGRCWIALGGDELARPARRLLEVRAAGAGTEARFELPQTLPLGVLELGEMRLAPPPKSALVAAGSVLDELGRAVAAAQIRVVRASEPSGADDPHWLSHEVPPVASADDGTFEIRAELEPGEYALSLRKPGFQPIAARPFAVGSSELALELERGAALEGALRLEPELTSSPFYVALRRGAGEPSAKHRTWRDGSFFVRDVAPGRVDLLVYSIGASSPNTVVEDLELVAGETSRDARIQALDLRGKFRKLEFTVRAPDGEPVRGGMVDAFSLDRASPSVSFAFPRDRVTLVVDRGPVDVRVRAHDCRPTWFRADEAPDELVMDPLLTVRLRLRAPFELAPGVRLQPILRYQGVRLSSGPRGEHAFDERGEVELRLGDAGRYRIAYELSLEKDSGSRTSTVIAPEPMLEIDVPGQDAASTFVLELPERELEAALARLR